VILRALTILGLALCFIRASRLGAGTASRRGKAATIGPEEEETERRGSPLLRIPILGPTLAPTFPALSNYRSSCSGF